jgi:SAM-dependent methyltransferase
LVRDDIVIKIQEPGASRRERLRTLAGREVGQRTGLFVVPEILSFDDASGKITFERLRLTWLREALSDPARSMELVGRAAAALAAIHGHMESPDGAIASSPGGMGTGPKRDPVPLHGDFGMRNVFCLPDSDRLAIIDWSNAGWIGFDADLGPAEIDVAVFLMSLFQRRVFGPWPIPRRHDVARHFLTTYSSASPHGLDLAILGEIVAASTPGFNRQTRRRKGTFLALGYRHNMVDLRLFLLLLSGQRFAIRATAAQVDTMDRSRTSARYTDRHKGRGSEYHGTFSPDVNPYRAMTWRLEQRALDGILRDHLPSGTFTHLDFACGTGRTLEYFARHPASSTGVDVSSSMMDVAKAVAPEAELIEADLTEQDVLGERTFDMITVFRFFPKAEPELRQSVISVLARHLAPDGLLVFNNHKNRNSLRARISRLGRRGSAGGTMTHAEVEALLPRAGLRILKVIPVASLPLSDKHVLLPLGLVEPLERVIGGWSPLAGLAQDIIYVCARDPQRQVQSNSSPSH